jgi:hypothetical protein
VRFGFNEKGYNSIARLKESLDLRHLAVISVEEPVERFSATYAKPEWVRSVREPAMVRMAELLRAADAGTEVSEAELELATAPNISVTTLGFLVKSCVQVSTL